ncbi:hypothetical protein O9G_005545 [Rozella allomycis CSF55]|nr:hypothetical protein O9G_005545 [Rozella allomycis CSF55]|eukprot:EPZ30804.1 hypothetical protein O9G_005545 [Rozella allomycis CSF55]
MIVMHRNAFAMHVNRHLSQRYSNYSRKTQTIVEERPVEEATNPTSGVMVSKKPNPALANMFTTTNRQTYQNKSNTYFNYFKPVPQVMFLVDEQERRVRHVARS